MAIDKKAVITYVQLLKEDLAVFRLVPNDGVIPNYEAGQFITVGMPIQSEDNKIIRRAYSIASHPENKKYIELVVRWVRKPLPGRVCVSGGTGIAPFMSFARHLHDLGDKRELVCLHGSSYVDELSYKDELTALDQESLDRGANKWNFKYRASISRPQEWFNRSWSGQTGRVEQFLKPTSSGKSPLEELVGEKVTPDNTIFYVCGWQGTVDGVLDYVRPKGFLLEKEKDKKGNFSVKFESYG